MKRSFKILLISLLVLGAVIVAVAGAIFVKLPSPARIGQAMTRKPKVVTALAQPVLNAPAGFVSADSAANTLDSDVDEHDEVRSYEEKEVMRKDLLDPAGPVSNFCGSLAGARTTTFQESDEMNDALNDSFFSEDKDPRIQAMKPFLRYVFQLPKMSQLIREADVAADKGEDSFADKASFYAKIYTALGEVQEHKTELEGMIDRSYFYLGLNNLVALKPELLADARLQNYCAGVEVAFNQKRKVAFDEEKADFLNFLNDVDVQPSEIHFDPEYKTAVGFELNPSSVALKGRSWLSEVFKVEDDAEDSRTR